MFWDLLYVSAQALRQLAEEGEKDGGEDDKDKEEVSKYAEMEASPK